MTQSNFKPLLKCYLAWLLPQVLGWRLAGAENIFTVSLLSLVCCANHGTLGFTHDSIVLPSNFVLILTLPNLILLNESPVLGIKPRVSRMLTSTLPRTCYFQPLVFIWDKVFLSCPRWPQTPDLLPSMSVARATSVGHLPRYLKHFDLFTLTFWPIHTKFWTFFRTLKDFLIL